MWWQLGCVRLCPREIVSAIYLTWACAATQILAALLQHAVASRLGCPALHRPLQHLRTTLPKPFESLNTNVAKLCGHVCWTVLAYFYFTMRLRSIQGTATSASRGAECATFGARNAAPRRQRHLDKRSNKAISAFSATAAPFDRMQPPAKPASETVVSVEFQCPAGSLAARLLRHHPLAVLQTAAHGMGVTAHVSRRMYVVAWPVSVVARPVTQAFQ